MSTKRQWQYTLADVAVASGKPINSVRDDKQKGLFDPDSLKSVALYIVSFITKRKAHA